MICGSGYDITSFSKLSVLDVPLHLALCSYSTIIKCLHHELPAPKIPPLHSRLNCAASSRDSGDLRCGFLFGTDRVVAVMPILVGRFL